MARSQGYYRTTMNVDTDRVGAPLVELLAPELLDALVERETRIRIDYRSMPDAPRDTARQFLRGTAAFIEFTYVSTVLVEVAHQHGAKTIQDTATNAEANIRLVHALTSLDLTQVLEDNAPILAEVMKAGLPSFDQPLIELSKLVSVAESVVQSFPVAGFVDLANKLNAPELGARCQVALDGLQRFAKRNDPWLDQRLRVVGPDYASGALSLDDVAQVLGLNRTDAVARLEECGYARPLEHIALDEMRRAELYASLREFRLNRDARSAATSSKVVRDVVATQRIEGVDARPWIEPKLM